jgi:hypothetical protein
MCLRIIRSGQFTFLIGEEQKPIVVHAAALAAISTQMASLINGRMKEAETRCAELKDCEVDDFVRVCEYAYRGDYTVPSWEIEQAPERTDEQGSTAMDENTENTMNLRLSQAELSDEWASLPRIKKKGKKRIFDSGDELSPGVRKCSKSELRALLDGRNYLIDENPKIAILDQCKPRSNTEPNQCFVPVFLAHARLYSFANMRFIDPLKALALHKIHITLMGFKLYERRVGDIMELARYAYHGESTPSRKDDGTVDELRGLVVKYIACEIDTVGKCPEFQEMMEQGGEFVGDFWNISRIYLMQ